MRVPIPKAAATIVAILGAGVVASYAGTFSHDFNHDPSADLVLKGNAAWRPTGGQGDPSVSGYLSITDAINGQSGKIVFDDFDNGKIVAAFNFDVDLRVGGGTASPADGYSISYAREGDGSLDNDGNPDGNDWASSPTGEANLPEEGVKNGISVCIDEWFSGGADVIGITVRVDNEIVFNKPYPTLNGNVTDLTSLQTGPASRPPNPADGSGGTPYDVNDHGWAHLHIEVHGDGTITVSYKGEKILDNFQTPYGPSAGRIVFAGRTGGANSNHHADNLSIETFPADLLVIAGASGNAAKYHVGVADNTATDSILDPASATFTLDGNAVTPVSSDKPASITTFHFENAPGVFFAPNSTHELAVSVKDGHNNTISGVRKFTVGDYTTVPAALASGVDPTSAERGFKARVHWLGAVGRYPGDANYTINAERELAEGYLDETGVPIPNNADLSTAVEGNTFNVDGVINMDQAGAAQGTFRAPAYPESTFPGLTSGDPNNFAIEFSGYVQLDPGFYTLGVASDDGFKHTVGRGLSDFFGIRLGEFNGGRGVADSLYSFVITAPGLYPMRWSYWEGGGGANIEIYSVTDDGVKHLLNDDTDPASILVYRSGLAKSYIRTTMPVPRQFGGAASESPVVVEVVDGTTPAGAITLTYDGVAQAVTPSKEGAVTTLRLDFANGQIPGDHTIGVAFDDVSQTYTFNVSRLPRSAGDANFVIEAEDFNNNGDVDPSVNTMPYLGGAMNGTDAVLNKDFWDEDGADSDLYRVENGGVQKVNIVGNGGVEANRGSWDATSPWRIGWIGAGEWFNYKRTVPTGDYLVFAGLSFDGVDNGQLHGRLFLTPNSDTCEAQLLGTFNGYGTASGNGGGWGVNNLVAMKDDAGDLAVYHSDGTSLNYRFHADSGDYDYFAFVPTTDASLGPVVAEVAGGAKVNGPFYIRIQNRVAKVDKTTVALKIDAAAATFTTTDLPNGLAVNATSAAGFGAIGSSHTYELTFKDNNAKSYTKSGNFNVIGNTFFIEAEDFNVNGGQTVAKASRMPYYGGAFDGLCAIEDIDVSNHDDYSSVHYRTGIHNQDGSSANINITGQGDVARDGWDIASNYRIGWIDSGNWHNYTRDFPAGPYQVWVALSFDGHDPHQLAGSLQMVTSDPSQPNQTVDQLGTFDAPGSGGWGLNNLVQLKDADGQAAVVTLGGTQTIRFTAQSGDYDYLKFVPFLAVKIVDNGNGTATVSWTSPGALFSAPAVTGPWTAVQNGGTSPVTIPIGPGALFLRTQQ